MEKDGEGEEEWEEAGRYEMRGRTSDGVWDRSGSEGGKVPVSDVRRPAGRVLSRHPGPVLGGRGQRGDELLPGPVISSFSARQHFVAPDTSDHQYHHCLLLLSKYFFIN